MPHRRIIAGAAPKPNPVMPTQVGTHDCAAFNAAAPAIAKIQAGCFTVYRVFPRAHPFRVILGPRVGRWPPEDRLWPTTHACQEVKHGCAILSRGNTAQKLDGCY